MPGAGRRSFSVIDGPMLTSLLFTVGLASVVLVGLAVWVFDLSRDVTRPVAVAGLVLAAVAGGLYLWESWQGRRRPVAGPA